MDYLKRCAKKFDALKFIRFEHRITSAIWDEQTAQWSLDIENKGDTIHDVADIFINAFVYLHARSRRLRKGELKLHWSAAADS